MRNREFIDLPIQSCNQIRLTLGRLGLELCRLVLESRASLQLELFVPLCYVERALEALDLKIP